MLGAAFGSSNGGRTSSLQAPRSFDTVSREDIYRQRVLGRDSGMKDFIHVHDKRQLTVPELLLYVIFLGLAINFCQTRVHVDSSYQINSIIEKSLLSTPYQVNPDERTFLDIGSLADVKEWLLVGLPRYVTPEVATFNSVLGNIRFTMRKIKTMESEDPRFAGFVPVVWETTDGIKVDDKSTEFDDVAPFGSYRSWSPDSMGLLWSIKKNKRCGGQLLETSVVSVEDPRDPELKEEVVAQCQRRCEAIMYPNPCTCFIIYYNFQCQFYSLQDQHLMVTRIKAEEEEELDEGEEVVVPRDLGPLYANNGTDMYYPRMKKFHHSSELALSEIGYRGTKGFVQYLFYPLEETLERAGEVPGGDPTPWTKSQFLANQISDWLGGDFMGKGVAALAVDIVTVNANFNIFSWIQIIFQLEPSGRVTPSYGISSLNVDSIASQGKVESFADTLSTWDYIYLGLIGIYCLLELWEFIQGWKKYIGSLWNHLAVVMLAFNVGTVVTYQQFKEGGQFDEILTAFIRDDTSVLVNEAELTIQFEQQMLKYSTFLTVSAFNLLFLFLNLVHFLNDTVPRVKVLVDAMSGAKTPIIFFIIIIFPAFFGAVFMAMVIFGKSSSSFSSLDNSISSSVQMLFGQVEALHVLRETYPVVGIVYFIIFVVVFVVILQMLPSAVVIASYADACDISAKDRFQEESRKRAAESDDKLSRVIRRVRLYVGRLMNDRGNGASGGSGDNRTALARRRFDTSNFVVHTIFLLMYTAMSYLMIQIDLSNMLRESIEDAVMFPTFETVMPVSNEVNPRKNFSTVSSIKDIMEYLELSLPQTMFESSKGTFNGQASLLRQYHSALPMEYPQIVISNWNIAVGQEPFRITTRYFKMVSTDESTGLGAVIDGADRIRAKLGDMPTHLQDGVPEGDFLEATTLEEIDGESTRAVLKRWCNGGNYTAGYKAQSDTDRNGFVCMLSVNESLTREMLRDMSDNAFVTQQTASVVIDFVLYNGFSEAFAYVSIIFDLEPNGEVAKKVLVNTVRLELFHDILSYLRGVLEGGVILFSIYFFFQALLRMFRAASQREGGPKRAKGAVRIFSFMRALIVYLIKNPFTVMDFVSSVMTLATMGLWYGHVFSHFRLNYYFQEYPTWTQGVCDSAGWTWCSDGEVIQEFSKTVLRLRQVRMVLGINTVLVFVRYLRFLQAFPRIQVIFNTFYGGMEDIFWFVIVMICVLTGYVMMGNQLFGYRVSGLRTYAQGYRYCYEMFLGHFNYNELKVVAPMSTPVFFFSYMIMFRFMFLNMFLAIINKQFLVMERARAREEEALKTERKLALQQEPKRGFLQLPFFRRRGASKSVGGGSGASAAQLVDKPPAAEKLESPAAGALVEQDHAGSPSAELLANDGALAPMDARLSDDGLGSDGGGKSPEIADGIIDPKSSWHILPPDMKSWALETASELNHFVTQLTQERTEIQRQEGEASEFDRCLEEAETSIKRRRTFRRQEALNVQRQLQEDQLARLREVQQDQESLSWYIMNREAELKKLETTKELKQDRFDKMVKAAKSLISADEPGSGSGATGTASGDPLALTGQ